MVSIRKIIIGKISAIERSPLALSSTVPPASIVYPAGSFFSNSASAGASCALTVFASMPGSRHALAQAELVLSNAVFDASYPRTRDLPLPKPGKEVILASKPPETGECRLKSLAYEVRAEARGYSP